MARGAHGIPAFGHKGRGTPRGFRGYRLRHNRPSAIRDEGNPCKMLLIALLELRALLPFGLFSSLIPRPSPLYNNVHQPSRHDDDLFDRLAGNVFLRIRIFLCQALDLGTVRGARHEDRAAVFAVYL